MRKYNLRSKATIALWGGALLTALSACSSNSDSSTHDGQLVEVLSQDAGDEPVYYLKTADRWIELDLKDAPGIAANQPVTIQGHLSSDGSSLAVSDIVPRDEETEIRSKSQELSSAAPAGKFALFLVRDDEITGEPVSGADIADELHTQPDSADEYFLEASFGQYGLDVDVFGWYSLDLEACDRGFTASQIEALAASQDGYDHTQYRHAGFLMMRNEQPCWGGGGWGTYGSPSGTGYSWYGSNDAAIYVHEVGHNLGLRHASGVLCRDHSGGFATDSGQCNRMEYHDPLDVMGWHSEFRHFNSHFKSQLGWLEPENVHQVANSGEYIVEPQEEPSTGIQSLLIPIPGSTEMFHVEARKDVGFDAGLGETVLVRKVRDGLTFQTYLLDMSPDSHQDGGENQRYSSLAIGQTYHDQSSGISIGLVGFNGESARIQVDLGGDSCSDGQHNGAETDVDCGGPCDPCVDGLSCSEHWDCEDYSCEAGTCADADGGGLRAEYFVDTEFGNRGTSNTVPTVDFDAYWSHPVGFWLEDNFSIRYSGKVVPRHSEEYTFITTTDDRVRLWVDGQLLIDDTYGTYTGAITLQADQEYDIVMEFVEYGGQANAQLRWMSASQDEEVIPKSRLRPGLCSVDTAIDLGLQGEPNVVPSDACVMISQYPSWYQHGGGTPALQTGAGGTYPIPASYEDACTGAQGGVTFTGAWQQHSVGTHQLACPTLIQLGGDGSSVTLRWF